MPINVTNQNADHLTREFADLAGVGLTEAIVIAMTEAIERRRRTETPLETAERLRREHGVVLTETARRPLARDVFDKMWDER